MSEIGKKFNSQALHAHKLIFMHPILNKKIEIISELPQNMSTLYKK